MKTVIKKSLQSLLLVPALALGVSMVAPVVQSDAAYAVDFSQGVEGGVNAAGTDQTNLQVDSLIMQIVNVLLYIIGAVAVIMIIFGGFKYITSAGDSSGVTSAKNTIMYAVIGLIVAVLAFAIVNFVLADVLNANASGGAGRAAGRG